MWGGTPGWGAPGGAYPGRRRAGGGWGGAREQQTVLSLAMLLAQQAAAMEHKPPLTLALAACECILAGRLGAGCCRRRRRSAPLPARLPAHRWSVEPPPASCARPPRIHTFSVRRPTAVQVLFYLRPEGLDWVPSTRRGCLQPGAVLGRGQWGRALWAPWLHADALHLYYNMSSFLWKVGQEETD